MKTLKKAGCAALAAQLMASQLATGSPAEKPATSSQPSTIEAAETTLEVPGISSVFAVVVMRFERSGELNSTTRGTAFAYENEGGSCVLMTATHVVKDASEISVYPWKADLTLDAGHEARVMWSDDTKDMAALTIKGPGCKPLARKVEPVPIGRRVFTFLNSPQGNGMVKSGIVGGYWTTEIGPTAVLDLQVHPGQSGSPAIDAKGNLIGMVVSRTLGAEAVGAYAVPAAQIDAEYQARKRVVLAAVTAASAAAASASSAPAAAVPAASPSSSRTTVVAPPVEMDF